MVRLSSSAYLKKGLTIRKPLLLIILMLLVAVLVACAAALAQPLETRPGPERYIVVLNNGVSDPGQVANAMARRHGLGVGFVYSHALKGFSAVIPNEYVGAVRADKRVAYIEPDKTTYPEAQTLPWGIDRVEADLSSTKAGNGAGAVSNVNVYIIDTGIYRHTDLNVVSHVNFTRDGKNTDCNGHGTHVAGIAAAKDNGRGVVGVAPGAPLTGVKIISCAGTGAASTLIEGVDWVTAHAKEPAIANMSVGLGGNPSQSLDDAVRKSAKSGVFYSLAAGNKGESICGGSPARTGAGIDNGIMTVAATDELDEETSWSNYGSCVDIWAPGARILSTKMGGGTTTMGGTSMAAPHVGGGGALYLSKNTGASPTSVEAALKDGAASPGTRSKDGHAIVLEYVGGF